MSIWEFAVGLPTMLCLVGGVVILGPNLISLANGQLRRTIKIIQKENDEYDRQERERRSMEIYHEQERVEEIERTREVKALLHARTLAEQRARLAVEEAVSKRIEEAVKEGKNPNEIRALLSPGRSNGQV